MRAVSELVAGAASNLDLCVRATQSFPVMVLLLFFLCRGKIYVRLDAVAATHIS